ncbi:hypothetical protein AMECASPLE_036158 [Ameca splendens]|uniref:Uncharacterized protein n=1 Tax=Ameca splendens TaxID=208324 RepID=A0ABV0YIN1_9TELE
MRPYYVSWEFSHVTAVHIPALLMRTQALMLCSRSSAGCRHCTHMFCSSSLETSNTHLPHQVCPHTPNMSPAQPETIKILNLFYASTKETPLGRADHNIVHLQTLYKPVIHRQNCGATCGEEVDCGEQGSSQGLL